LSDIDLHHNGRSDWIGAYPVTLETSGCVC